MNYYISDTHFSHGNILRFDHRPFETVEEMDRKMVQYWNRTVKNSDDVYIVGDFCWGKESRWLELLPKLNGKKHLIMGNHDLRQMSVKLRSMFESIDKLTEIVDEDGHHIILCHYPLLVYRSNYDKNIYMFYGHVHNTQEYQLVRKWKQEIKEATSSEAQLYNCWCGFYDWRPATFEQIVSDRH